MSSNKILADFKTTFGQNLDIPAIVIKVKKRKLVEFFCRPLILEQNWFCFCSIK